MRFAHVKSKNIMISIPDENCKAFANKIFPGAYKPINFGTETEMIKYFTHHLRFKVNPMLTTEPYSLFELLNTRGEIVLAYIGLKSECEILKKFFNGGIIATDYNAKELMFTYGEIDDLSVIVNKLEATAKNLNRFLVYCCYDKDAKLTEPKDKIFVKIKEENTFCNDQKKIDFGVDCKDDPVFTKLLTATNDLFEACQKLNEDKAIYGKQLEDCDKAMLDYLHDIEFNFEKMNAAQGYNFAKIVHENRVTRRIAKDKIEVISIFQDFFNYNTLMELKDIDQKISERKYRWRTDVSKFNSDLKTTDKMEIKNILDCDDNGTVKSDVQINTQDKESATNNSETNNF